MGDKYKNDYDNWLEDDLARKTDQRKNRKTGSLVFYNFMMDTYYESKDFSFGFDDKLYFSEMIRRMRLKDPKDRPHMSEVVRFFEAIMTSLGSDKTVRELFTFNAETLKIKTTESKFEQELRMLKDQQKALRKQIRELKEQNSTLPVPGP